MTQLTKLPDSWLHFGEADQDIGQFQHDLICSLENGCCSASCRASDGEICSSVQLFANAVITRCTGASGDSDGAGLNSGVLCV